MNFKLKKKIIPCFYGKLKKKKNSRNKVFLRRVVQEPVEMSIAW